MLDRIANILQRECKLLPENLMLVGVSGGPDSLCLMHALHYLGYPILAMHVNHQLRPEAEAEAQVVKQFSDNLGVGFIATQVDVLMHAQENTTSIEEAARTLRYRSLFEQAKKYGANAVVVGHNADDQVETILMHLLRGSGLAGLRGMEYRTVPNPWSEDIPLLRPLLTIWRSEIQDYIEEHEFEPILDSSNLDISYFRNRIRHELLPILESYNPDIREVLLRMGQSLKDDYSFLQLLTDKAWESALIKQGSGYLAFNKAVLLELPLSVQRYLLRRAIAYHLPGLRDVGFDCIERGLGLLAGDKQNSQTDLIAGLRLIDEGEQFRLATRQADWIGEDFPAIMPGELMKIMPPATQLLKNGWQVEVTEIRIPEVGNHHWDVNLDPFQAWLDVNGLDLPLTIRARKPGDQIKPLGLNGHSMKISDLMINLRLPRQARATWPLVCSGDQVVWVPGYRLSHLVRLRPDTASAIHLLLSRNRAT